MARDCLNHQANQRSNMWQFRWDMLTKGLKSNWRMSVSISQLLKIFQWSNNLMSLLAVTWSLLWMNLFDWVNLIGESKNLRAGASMVLWDVEHHQLAFNLMSDQQRRNSNNTLLAQLEVIRGGEHVICTLSSSLCLLIQLLRDQNTDTLHSLDKPNGNGNWIDFTFEFLEDTCHKKDTKLTLIDTCRQGF